ncbi:microsomal glutathione S-transferase 1-like [Asterias rubens]|uniref:microsomal glutathione S-transferase 1-like n=1 Tax=Asterias rubens TaxID=7604 RepID=UPI001455648B|nr:microsomal glutathione S-transferase 1-like [Asterias rubens]
MSTDDQVSLLSFDNEVFRLYAWYATAVTVKMMLMSIYVSQYRLRRKVVENPEDVRGDKVKAFRRDEDIERGRRCHRNDMENIPPFLIVGLLYVLTGPTVYNATWYFRVFAGSRFFHTVAYLLPLPQPSRALGFFVGWCTIVSMAINVLKTGQM